VRNLLAQGAIGALVREVQNNLASGGFLKKPCDGVYGRNTADAVSAFQQAKSVPNTGAVDDHTWPALCNRAVPPVSARSLQLTASFENHGFGLALGNFDGALLTWGIIGFTLSSGKVQRIVAEVQASHPEKVQEAFGASADELLGLMKATKARQTTWANNHTVQGGQLAEPWRTMFATFGSYPEVQDAQMALVHSDYLVPSLATCRAMGLTSELGLALAFDIQVQNGGIKPAIRKLILAKRRPNTKESDLRKMIANAVADSAKAKWREDVRSRKLTVATGKGTVHGHAYVLDAWGLNDQFVADEI